MKIRYLLPMAALMAMAGIAFAGTVQPAPVVVDLDNMFAGGDQWTARTADNDIDFIGCGIRRFDDGVNPFEFGFCQAGDSDGNEIVCFTTNAYLLEAMHSINSFSFITFTWRDDDPNFGPECIRIGSSTQSFYLPAFETDDDSDSDSD